MVTSYQRETNWFQWSWILSRVPTSRKMFSWAAQNHMYRPQMAPSLCLQTFLKNCHIVVITQSCFFVPLFLCKRYIHIQYVLASEVTRSCITTLI
jgi:hypothetical protein